MNGQRVSRRAMIAGVGAGLLTIPTLGSFERSFASTPAAPKRLVIMQGTNGVLNPWWPASQGANFPLTDALKPLQKYQSQMNVIGGLGLQAGMDTANNGVGHHSFPYLLTGVKGVQGSNSEGAIGIGNGISVDQVVAKASGRPIPSLELGAFWLDDDSSSRSISYNGPAKGSQADDRPPEIDPRKVFARLNGFGSMAGVNQATLNAIKAQKSSVLDAVAKDLAAISSRLAQADRDRLSAHLDAVRSLEKELTATAPASCGFTSPPGNVDVSAIDDLQSILQMQLKLLASAFTCDVTRVATVCMMGSHNTGVTFPWLGSQFPDQGVAFSDNEHHGIAHGAGDGSGSTADLKTQIDTWYMTMVAWFCDQLAAITDVDGRTVLDNTLIVWINNMGIGASHNIDNIPIVTVGGQWYLKGGQYVKYSPKPHNALLVEISNALGVATTKFGDYDGNLSDLRK